MSASGIAVRSGLAPQELEPFQVTYVQIHEDSIKDLLTEQLDVTPRTPSVTLREGPGRGVFMENVRQVFGLHLIKQSDLSSQQDVGKLTFYKKGVCPI